MTWSDTSHYDRILVSGTVIRVTPKAVLFRAEGMNEDDEVWLPKAQIDVDGEGDNPYEVSEGEEACFELPLWLARERGLE